MANDLVSGASLEEEQKQTFVLKELIKEFARLHLLLSAKLGHPTKDHVE